MSRKQRGTLRTCLTVKSLKLAPIPSKLLETTRSLTSSSTLTLESTPHVRSISQGAFVALPNELLTSWTPEKRHLLVNVDTFSELCIDNVLETVDVVWVGIGRSPANLHRDAIQIPDTIV